MRNILLLTLANIVPAQQQCASRNDDGTLVTNTSMGGPNLLLGMRLVAEGNYTVSAIQVPTGLVSGPGSMAIFDHDAVNDRPNQNVSGSGIYTQSNVIAWQGASLPTPIAVTAGQVFWVVWGMPNGSRTPWSTNTVGDVPYRASFDGGLTWNGQNNGATPWPAKPYKIRLFCPYLTNPILSVGQGKLGAVGVPTIEVTGWSAQSNELGVILNQAAPASPAVLAIGTQTQFQVPGIADVYVNPILTVLVTTTGTAGRDIGTASLPIPIPSLGARGFPLAVQWFVIDPLALNSVAHTSGRHTTIN